MEFRETIKSMYSLQVSPAELQGNVGLQILRNTFVMFGPQTPQIGYKDLMMSYHNKVNTLGQGTKKTEISLVVNLFQSMLDGFIRGEIKRAESELPKVFQTPELSGLPRFESKANSRLSVVLFLRRQRREGKRKNV